MIFFAILLLCGPVIVPIIVGLIESIQVKLDQTENLNQIKNIDYNNFLKEKLTINNQRYKIINFPQLSFDRWLTLFNASAENWTINVNQSDKGCVCPIYHHKKQFYATYWETPEDLYKFQQWIENEYKQGKSTNFQQQRDEQLAKLTKALQEDIANKQEEARRQIDALEQQVRDAMPEKQEKEDPIQKCLREQRENKAQSTMPAKQEEGPIQKSSWKQRENKVEEIGDIIRIICEKCPKHNFDHTESYRLSDGTPVAYVYLKARDPTSTFFDVKAVAFYDNDKKSWTIDDTVYNYRI